MEQTLVWLIVNNEDEPATVALLKGRYREAEEPLTKLVTKVTTREVKLNDIVTVGVTPENTLKEVEKELKEFEDQFTTVEPVSAKYDVAMKVQEQHKVSTRLIVVEVVRS